MKRNISEEISALTYSKYLQGRFVSGHFTTLVLLCAALCMWAVSLFVDKLSSAHDAFWGLGGFLTAVVTLFCLVIAAVVLGSFNLFERRVRWLASLFLWLASASPFLSGNVTSAFSILFLLVIIAFMFHCQTCGILELMLYKMFFTVGIATLFFPSFLLLLPVFMFAPFAGNNFGFKKILAMFLGLLTPFWLLFGGVYVYPALEVLAMPFLTGLDGLFQINFSMPSMFGGFIFVSEMLVLFPFIFCFLGSSIPGKPTLRRRLVFILSLYVYLLLISIIFGNHELFFAWRLPLLTIMVSFVFSLKINRWSNIYFIFLNLIWLATVPLYIWLT